MFDLKHIDKNEMEQRLKRIEDSRHVRMSRCYSNINKKYYNYNIREQINFNDNPNIFKKEEILKKPGIILHVDRRFRLCREMQE